VARKMFAGDKYRSGNHLRCASSHATANASCKTRYSPSASTILHVAVKTRVQKPSATYDHFGKATSTTLATKMLPSPEGGQSGIPTRQPSGHRPATATVTTPVTNLAPDLFSKVAPSCNCIKANGDYDMFLVWPNCQCFAGHYWAPYFSSLPAPGA
jgi:hypothetical protein